MKGWRYKTEGGVGVLRRYAEGGCGEMVGGGGGGGGDGARSETGRVVCCVELVVVP